MLCCFDIALRERLKIAQARRVSEGIEISFELTQRRMSDF